MRKPPHRRRAASPALASEVAPSKPRRVLGLRAAWALAGGLTVAGIAGCGTIGYERVPSALASSAARPASSPTSSPTGPGATPASAADPKANPQAADTKAAEAGNGPVILVVVDGLRRDVLAKHMEILADFDQVPPWPSGLALLADGGFRLARTDRAETTVPGIGLGPWTALATGHYAGRSGVPASRFHVNDEAGRLRSLDFTGASDAAHIFFGTGFVRPTADEPPALQARLGVPTLGRRAAKAGRKVLAVFDPFGHGADWLIPETSGAGVNALLMHPVGAAAAPLYDRGVRDAALDGLQGEPDFDLMTLTFRSVEVESCLESVRRCRGHAAVANVQAEALKRLDGHLWRVLRALQVARPARFKRLTLLLVSPGGVADLDPALAPVLSDEQVVELVETAAGQDCKGVLTERLARGDLVFDGDSAVGLLSLRGAPIGRQQVLDAPRRCVDAGLRALMADPEGPFAAAGWRQVDGAVRTKVFSRDGERVSAARGPRIAARMQHALTGPLGARRTGEAILILRQPRIFDDAGTARHGRRGGLEPAATEAAFLLASRGLTDEAVAAMRSQAVELVDVAPTILRLLDVPATDLERPPLLAPDPQGRLVPVLADRSPRPVSEAAEGLFMDETAESLSFGLSEAASIWPPDVFVARVDDARHAWDVDTGTFATGSPCAYTEDKVRRRWTCTVPRASLGPGRHLLAVRRAPAPSDDAPEDSAQEGHWIAVIEGDAAEESAPRLRKAALVCADADRLKVAVDVADPLGLMRLAVFMADSLGAGTPDRMPALATVDLALDGVAGSLPVECKADITGPECTLSQAPTELADTLSVAMPAAMLAHGEKAARLPAAAAADPAAFRTLFESLGGGDNPNDQPRRAFLGVEVCNVAGRCTRHVLATDRAWRTALEGGCP